MSLDAAVFNFDKPWSTDTPPANPKLIADANPELIEDANPDLIKNENPRSPAQSPGSPRGKSSAGRLSKAASRSNVSDNYVEI